MLDSFEIATGTTAGSKHRRGLLTPNQSAALGYRSEGLITGVISDGGSEAPLSHVASPLHAEWFTGLTHEHALSGKPFDEDAWRHIANEIAARILQNARWSHLPEDEAIRRMWAATVGGFVLTPEFTHLAMFGDGRFYINGKPIVFDEAMQIKGQPAPAYPCYLVSASIIPTELLQFRVLTFPTAEVQHAVAADDGLDYLLKSTGKKVPGFDDHIPGPSYLWETDELFRRSDALDTWLNFIGRDWQKKSGNPLVGGRLQDDLAIAVVRRKKTSEA